MRAQETSRLVVAPGELLRVEAAAGESVEVAFGGGVLTPVAGPLKAPDSGEHWLALAGRDEMGAVSPVRWVRVVVDADPPECTLKIGAPLPADAGPAPWVRAGTAVSISAADALSGPPRVELNAGGATVAEGRRSASAVLQEEGEVHLRGTCRDAVGNEATALADVRVDGRPPTGSLGFEGDWVDRGGRAVAAPGVAVTIRWADTGSGVARRRISRDGSWQQGDRLEGPWGEGRHQVAARAADAVGNESATASIVFVVDATPPSVRCTPEAGIPGGSSETWLPPGSVLSCEAADAVAGVEAVEWWRGGAWHPAEGGVPLEGQEVRVRATDRVGNATVIVPAFRADAQPPSLELVRTGGGTWDQGEEILLRRGEAVSVLASDGQSGVARVEYRIGGGPWSPVKKRVVFRDRGSFALEIRAVDRVGNESRGRWRVLVARHGGGGS